MCNAIIPESQCSSKKLDNYNNYHGWTQLICLLLSDPDSGVCYSPLVLAYCLPDDKGHVLCHHKLKVWLQDPLECGKPSHLLITQLVASYPFILQRGAG